MVGGVALSIENHGVLVSKTEHCFALVYSSISASLRMLKLFYIIVIVISLKNKMLLVLYANHLMCPFYYQ